MTAPAELLDRLAPLGPYFAVATAPPPDAASYRPLAALPGAPFEDWTALVGARLGTGAGRVAASTVHLGHVARLWSLALGPVALGGGVPDLGPDRLRFALSPEGAPRLWAPGPTARPAAEDPVPALLALLAAHLTPLHVHLRTRYGLSPRTLRGNTASALTGTVRVLLDRLPGAPRDPGHLAARLLRAGDLGDGGTYLYEPDLGVAYRRESCCLYYRTPRGTLCGDCVLHASPARGKG
ncbi:(2Fe-2S)-binding protein [Streptomyces sp. SPB074]|uniref:(2Fe-2S)-binding protein n=1 Tax=Streptomyces sp. (strain SPB074) TaxID=465543 RepID=UPI00056B6B74|nr:(2Fe-2S)-binding protein [Streptomyces sp. SPB074]